MMNFWYQKEIPSLPQKSGIDYYYCQKFYLNYLFIYVGARMRVDW